MSIFLFSLSNVSLFNLLIRNKNIYNLSRQSTKNTNLLTSNEVYIKSCGPLYLKWKKQRKFSKLPNSDLTFNVTYFDTNTILKRKTLKTVVALHGAPGSCHDFNNLAGYFLKKGIRVVVPTFPNFSTFPPGVFRHSDEEKAQFVQDFLNALSVSEVDLLICHSSAIYPGLHLCVQQKPVVRSLAMLNIPSFHTNILILKWFKTLKLLVKASEIPIFLKTIELMFPYMMKLIKSPVKYETFLDPLLSATVMVHANILQSKERFLHLQKANFPILYAFSEDDKLIGKNNAYELAHFLGAMPQDISYVNKEGIMERQGNKLSLSRYMAFENGSHYVFWKYPDIINEELYNFLLKNVNNCDIRV